MPEIRHLACGRAIAVAGALATGFRRSIRAHDAHGGGSGCRRSDRRPVTVLFADLCGFTALSERLDPEDIRALQNDLFAELTAAVTDVDGFVEKYVGDALLALFGAPVAHEDDPERALRAALSMCRRTADLSSHWQDRIREPLALHIGVNTGPVVAGTVGAGAANAYSVTGDTVNTAARLQSAAAPGQILVGPVTHRLTRSVFQFEAMGDLRLKGKVEALSAHQLLGELAGAGPARGLESLGFTAPLIARTDELGRMVAAAEHMRGGQAQVLRLVGEAGIGKSRLIEAFLDSLAGSAAEGTIDVRRAGCSALGHETYGLLAHLLRDAYGLRADAVPSEVEEKLTSGLAADGAGADEIARTLPPLAFVLGNDAGAGGLEHLQPEQLRRQILHSVRTLAERRLAERGLALVVEDLQWADAASIEVLRFLADRLHDKSFMLVLTHRPEFDAGPLAGGHATQTAMRLAPLSKAESDQMVAALLGGSEDGPPAAVRERIIGRGGGSQLVQSAAVLGPTFEARLLRSVARAPQAVEQELELLCEADIVEEVAMETGADQCYRFTQTLVQEVVYQNLLVQSRSEQHGAAGRALQAMHGGTPERLEDLEALAHHFSLSADKPTGANYLLQAGDRARRMYANDDARRHYGRALDALTAFEAVADGPAQARLLRKIGGLHWDAGDRDVAMARWKGGLAALGDDAEHIEIAHLCQEMGRVAFRSGDNQSAVDWAKRALAEAERLGAAPAGSNGGDAQAEAASAISHAYNTLGIALARSGELPDAVQYAERSVAVAEAEGLLHAACRGYTNLSVLYTILDPRRAIDICLKGLGVARRIGDLGFQSRLNANLAVAYCTFTDQCESEGIARADRGRARPPTRPARLLGSAPDRSGADLSVPWPARPGVRFLQRGAGARRGDR